MIWAKEVKLKVPLLWDVISVFGAFSIQGDSSCTCMPIAHIENSCPGASSTRLKGTLNMRGTVPCTNGGEGPQVFT